MTPPPMLGGELRSFTSCHRPVIANVRPRVAYMEKPSPDLDLPDDLVAFLAAGKQLIYDSEPCEAGAITLVKLSELKLERFPVETGSLAVYEQDPHYPDVKSYLVLGVDLVASCTGDYEAVGLLLWLPV